MGSKANVLVVDDDSEIRELTSELLSRNGFHTLVAKDVSAAEDILAVQRVDLVVLDVMLPGERGTSFCQRLRQGSSIPVLMLSALNEEVDRIVGLELGADDYLAKPFSPRELVLRIESLLRRSPPVLPGETNRTAERYEFSGLRLDPQGRTLTTVDGKEIKLTAGEFALLLVLIEHRPRILSRERLMDLTRSANSHSFDRSIDSQISRLRRKLRSAHSGSGLIKTARNLGYAFTGEIQSSEVVS